MPHGTYEMVETYVLQDRKGSFANDGRASFAYCRGFPRAEQYFLSLPV